MDITIFLGPTDLSAADEALVRESLGLPPGNVDDAFRRLCKTAFMEYLKMLKEKGIPTRADEVLQERLFFFLTYYYETRVPNEDEISTIFQLTPAQSKTLLRNFKTKYRTKISALVKTTLKSAVDAAWQGTTGNTDYHFSGTPLTVIEELNQIVRQNKPKLKPIEKELAFANQFVCGKDTRDYLQAKLT